MSDTQSAVPGQSASIAIGDLRDLVQAMAEWRKIQDRVAHLIVVSLGDVLPQAKRTPALVKQTVGALALVTGKHGGRIFRVAPCDFVILTHVQQHVLVGYVRDLKVEILKTIERQFPGSFGSIDQSRLMVSYDLTLTYRSGAERVSRYAALEQNAGNAPGKLRPLSEDDLKTVMQAYRQIGAEKFVHAFVRNQPVAQQQETGLSR
jgi:hypothetical protein